MKRFLITLFVVFTILMLSAMMQGQTPAHSVVLTWVSPNDATAAGVITIYRGIGDCSTSPTMSSVGSVAANLVTFTDPIGPGTYCYFVIHTENKTDSVASNSAAAVLRPNAASGLTLTVK